MKKCLFSVVLAFVCLVGYGQHSHTSRNASRHGEASERNHRHHSDNDDDDDDDDDRDRRRTDNDDDDDDDRNRRRKSKDDDDDKSNRNRPRRFNFTISGRDGGRLNVEHYEGYGDRNRRRDSNRNRFQRTPTFTFGPKVGLNYGTFLKNPVALQTDYQSGYHVGAFMRFNVRRAYLQPEVLFSTKGGELDLTANPTGAYQPNLYSVTVNNIDVPLLLGTRLIDNRVFNLRVFAGPMASFNVGGQGLDNFLGDNESTDYYLADVAMSYVAGLGIDLGTLTLDTRYEWTIGGAADLQRANLGKPRTGTFQVSLGIKLF